MSVNPLDAYRDTERNTLDGRALEAMVLAKASAALLAVRNQWEQPDLKERLDEALRYNQRLWTMFQVELANENNPLPDELRRNLLSLSLFVDKHTFGLMASPAPEKLDILISINQNIASGLSRSTSAINSP